MTDELVEKVARALKSARCEGREGPFGGYDYGYRSDGDVVVPGGRYVIRDFRDPSSPDWGKWLHQTDDQAEHDMVFTKMTEEYVARAVIPLIYNQAIEDAAKVATCGDMAFTPDEALIASEIRALAKP